MKLTQYLTESRESIFTYKKLVDLIRKNCSQYIKEVNRTSSNDRLFMREASEAPALEFGYVQKIRSDRKPIDVPYEIHQWLDQWLYDNFKIRGRSQAWFVWTKGGSASFAYKDYHYVFPYNGYRYVWSNKVSDIYSKIDKKLATNFFIEDFLEKYAKTYTTRNALKDTGTFNMKEVMLQAPKCVFANSFVINMKDNGQYMYDFWNDIGIDNIVRK